MLHKPLTELQKELQEKGFTYTPYTAEEINEAVEYFGTLPQVLIEYYQRIGYIKIPNSTEEHITIHSPKNLIMFHQKDAPFLSLSDEYCGMFELAVKREDLNEENPPVYISGEVAFMQVEEPEIEEELQKEGLLFKFEDGDGDEINLYICGRSSCFEEDFSLPDELSEDISPLNDLLSAINYFFRYDDAFAK